MRKAFNFYRSYYDVAILLPELERAEFLMCICHAQFTGELIEPKLPIAKLAYIGQLHSIKKQLEGYNYGLKTPKKTEPLKEPLEGAYESPLKEPLPQEQVQVQEKEKEEYNIDSRKKDFAALLQPYIETYGREMLNEFYFYWTEPNQRKTKMKYEMEKTWSIERRLNTWSKQSVKFGTAVSKAEKPKFDPYG
jgi:hypothetical protein